MRIRGSLSFLRRIVARKMAAVHNRGQSGEDNLTDIKITIHVALNFLPSSVIFRGIVYVQEIFVSWRENARIHDARVDSIACGQRLPAETRDSRGHVLFIRCPTTRCFDSDGKKC